ncbi:MAG: AAA family ATPase [Candidatus Electrothrix aestuarii]|uniref:AAA family ATPase n=1 Tax=Candidatus Electrothrix aestuarii TaxID=3062594 RepID=A0AAU8LRF4_9BACT|nr:AAA family ATPase [Candidatus Electrothrix aestuarii]
MKIPYGESDFKKIITQDFLYVDKTAYIAALENQGSFNILLRPRRFGKTLFLSTLRHYYDILLKDEFQALFGQLAIGHNPTPLRNSYQILEFDFSGIETGSQESIRQGFCWRAGDSLRRFLVRYGYSQDDVRRIEDEERNGPAAMLSYFFALIGEANIYLFIDEYDHFANAILAESLELFTEIVGKGGFVRAFYEVIKIATGQGIVDRLLITGVTSITLDSMTSGFNIGNNITWHKDFNQATGFTAQETGKLIQPFVEACELNQQDVMQALANWYNGYRFSSRAEEKIFNPDMVLYFLRSFDAVECCWPERMLDDNIASDYGKIMRLFGIGDRDRNFEVLEELLVNGEIIGLHKGKLDLDMHKPFERDDFISLLLYMGFITISGTVLSQLRYAVPNYDAFVRSSISWKLVS